MWSHSELQTPAIHGPEHPLLAHYAEAEKPELDDLSRELRELIECIHQDLFEPGLNVKTVRQRCRIRDNNISSRFRRSFGRGIKAYIDGHRMAAACMLLTETKMAIFDIAMGVGYNHVETFYQVFHRSFDCTPGQYRQRRAEVPSTDD
jgi:AraC-like DNA-binding protein